MAIPKIIHQIWLSCEVPQQFKELSRSFTRMMPDWEQRLWDDDLGLELITEKFPDYLKIYESLDSPVAKSDLLRYMILFEYGGMYADMDCECQQGLDFIRDDDEFIVCKEVDTRSTRVMDMYPTDISPVYCQWTFLSRPGHPALGSVLEHIKRTIATTQSHHPILRVVKQTGPHAFTAGVNEQIEKGASIRILPNSYFGCMETKNTVQFMRTALFPALFRKVYIRHHFAATWMSDEVKRRMMIRNLLLMPEPINKRASK